MMKFRVKRAKYTRQEVRHKPTSRKADKNGNVKVWKTYTRGQVVESARDLMKAFGDTSFEEVHETVAATKPGRPRNHPSPDEDAVSAADSETDEGQTPDGGTTDSDEGEGRPGEGADRDWTDVTDEFDVPEGSVIVFRDVSNRFWVCDPDNPSTPLHDKGLKRSGVAAVLASREDGEAEVEEDDSPPPPKKKKAKAGR
jgi:hypothetical protein